MPQLNLIRAAAQDVASARVVLQERIRALDAIIQTALAHGISPAEAAKASEGALPTPGSATEPGQPVLMA